MIGHGDGTVDRRDRNDGKKKMGYLVTIPKNPSNGTFRDDAILKNDKKIDDVSKTSKNTGKKDENGIFGNPSEKNLQMELFAVMLYRKPKTRGDHRSIYYGGLIQGRYLYY